MYLFYCRHMYLPSLTSFSLRGSLEGRRRRRRLQPHSVRDNVLTSVRALISRRLSLAKATRSKGDIQIHPGTLTTTRKHALVPRRSVHIIY